MLRNQSINGNSEPVVIGLQLLAHIVSDTDLGARFLAMTGLAADDLRARAADPVVLAALVDFLASNEADLLAAASAIDVSPEAIITAGATLAGAATVESWP